MATYRTCEDGGKTDSIGYFVENCENYELKTKFTLQSVHYVEPVSIENQFDQQCQNQQVKNLRLGAYLSPMTLIRETVYS